MYKQLILAAACFTGVVGISQADTFVHPGDATGAYQAGHLMKISRVFLGYDQFGRPVYGHQHLHRQIIGYDRLNRPVYGVVYNNQPLAPAFGVFNNIVRPHDTGWNWGNRHWDQGDHRGFDHENHRGDEYRDSGRR